MTGVLAPRAPVEIQTDIDDAPTGRPSGRRRFTIAVVLGALVVSVPYLWVLWDLWNGSASPVRTIPPSNFYEYQARAIFAGHLDVPYGSLAFEGFYHQGREYTYFGLFPSLLRMPVLALTHRFDGRLTAPSLLLAWVTTGVFSSLLIWRTRVLVRGRALLGLAEAVSYGALVAAILGGSVIVHLAASPFVYNEDFAWSIALTTASLFALVGVLERPTMGRIIGCGVLILATNLNRPTTGYACDIGAFLIAAWFLTGRAGEGTRRRAVPVFLAGALPLAASCAITWAKFGLPFGLPMADQVWAQINAHRRYFLAANHGKAFNVGFIPSTALAYLQPAGLHVTSVFPYVSLPTTPARSVGKVVFDQTYPTSSMEASMPLLFLLSCWGVISAFRRRVSGHARVFCIPILVAGAATVGVLVWGYIANRYLSDFVPLLILAGAVGLADLWHRVAGRRRWVGASMMAGVVALCAVEVFINVAIAATPDGAWSVPQAENFVAAQLAVTPGPLAATVERGNRIPYESPSGRLFIAGNCSGLYVSTGFRYDTVPGQQLEHATWLPVEQAMGMNHTLAITFNRATKTLQPLIPLLTFGGTTLTVGYRPGFAQLVLQNPSDPADWPGTAGGVFRVKTHHTYQIQVMTDPNLNYLRVVWFGQKDIEHYLSGPGPAVVDTTPSASGGAQPQVTVSNVALPDPPMRTCTSLLQRL